MTGGGKRVSECSFIGIRRRSWRRGGGSWQRGGNPKKGQAAHNSSTPGILPEEMRRKGWKDKYFAKTCKVPQEVYDNLYQVFNPSKFDADRLVRTIKRAGAGYIVFTSKHHDGFCNFDSAYTDYDIMSAPYGRDICKQLADACHRYGVKLLWYYSKPDWYDPRWNPADPKPYEEYMAHQIEELCTHYGKIMGVWWDGGNDVAVDGRRIAGIIFRHQPWAIYNGRGGMRLPGRTFGTPEQKLGAFNRNQPWESCVTMQGEGWFWNGGRNIMTATDCIRLLVNAAVGDGNLLLDFGPDNQGRMPKKVEENFLAMGRWLGKYGESIYGTRGGPYKPGKWGGATCKGKTVYLHITQVWPGGRLTLPALPADVKGISCLTGGKPRLVGKDGLWTIELDAACHKVPDTIVKLELDKDAFGIEPLASEDVRFVSLNAVATASSYRKSWNGYPGSVTLQAFELNMKGAEYFGEDGGVKGDLTRDHGFKPTRNQLETYPWISLPRDHIWRYWMADKDDKTPWLELDFGREKVFNRITILEKFDRIDRYRVEFQADGKWVEIFHGNKLGAISYAMPRAVRARRVRIVIESWHSDDKEQGPGLREFDFWMDQNGPGLRDEKR